MDELTKNCVDSSVERLFLCIRSLDDESRETFRALMGEGQAHTRYTIELDNRS